MNLAPVRQIQMQTAQHFALPLRVLLNRDLSREAVSARQVAMFLAVTMLGKSKSEVGRRFGRDHSTVWNSINRVQENPDLLREAEAIRQGMSQ